MKLRKNFSGKFTPKGEINLKTLTKETEPQKLNCMATMKKFVSDAVKENGATKEQVIRSFGLIRRNAK